MIDHSPGAVVISNDGEGLTDLLREMTPNLRAVDRSALTLSSDDSKKLVTVLDSLVSHQFNTADGGVRAKIGSYQFPLRRTIYTALTLTVTFTGSVIAAVAEPIGGTVALVGTVLAAAQQAGDLINKLTPDEVVVYEALGSTLLEKRDAGVKQMRATVEDIEKVFDRRDLAPPDVAGTLQVLSQRNAIKVDIEARRPHYWIER
jgi:hypothetical protein